MLSPAPMPARPDFARAPFIVIWEVTRACDLACAHCRAEASPAADPHELTTAEGIALLDRIRAGFGPVLLVLTGGDPLKRADLASLVAHAARIGLRVGLTPSATPLLTTDALRELRDAGLAKVAVSLDGADAATHDAFRGMPGTYARSLAALEAARALGLATQINSSIGRHNEDQLDALARIGAWIGIELWSVFLLVPTGRAGADRIRTAAEHERTYRRLAGIALDPATPFDLKTTAGQPYQRVLAQERARRGLELPMRRGGRAPAGVNDGNGFLFISHTGGICPSGFLPLEVGDVRRDDPVEVYRSHPTFLRLRQPQTFSGKCGGCEFNRVCGGSRSRTYGMTGDPFASDPTCVHHPRAIVTV